MSFYNSSGRYGIDNKIYDNMRRYVTYKLCSHFDGLYNYGYMVG